MLEKARYNSLSKWENLSTYTGNIASVYRSINELDSAIFYGKKAVYYSQLMNKTERLATVTMQMSLTYQTAHQFDSASLYLAKALALKPNLVNKTSSLDIDISLAVHYLRTQQYIKSKNLSYKILHKLENPTDFRLKARLLLNLVECYKATKQLDSAFITLEALNIVDDSIMSMQKLKNLDDLKIKYETSLKEKENKLLKQERNLEQLKNSRQQRTIYTISILFLSITLILFLLYQQYKKNIAQDNLRLKHQLLRNQMSPHFIFNALLSIQGFIYKKDTLLADRYLSSFAKLLRSILENSREEFIPLVDELLWLHKYMELQQLRFKNRFEYTIHLDDNLDEYATLIPPMLAQPFVENALEHGFKSIDYVGHITLHFIKDNDMLIIKIQDNGIGINNSKIQKEHKSMAINITKERLQNLNKGNNSKIDFTITSIQPSGTLVAFQIPLIL